MLSLANLLLCKRIIYEVVIFYKVFSENWNTYHDKYLPTEKHVTSDWQDERKTQVERKIFFETNSKLAKVIIKHYYIYHNT